MKIIKILLICAASMIIFVNYCSAQNNDCKISNQTSNNSQIKIGIIVQTKEPEKAWNAFRFANMAKSQGYDVKVFLMGEGVECEGIVQEPFNVKEQMNAFVEQDGKILACGTCLQLRHLEGTATCPISTMADCVEMVAWADKTVSF